MKRNALIAGIIAASLVGFSGGAFAQTRTPQVQLPQQTPTTPGRITALVIDLQPIASRIEHGVVSVRNTGTAASAPSIVTVNCHLRGQQGGCPEIPAAALAQYTNPAYPNRLVVNVPAIQPGHVYNHNLSFEMNWPSGAYFFDFVVDASSTNNESNEANNTASHTWVIP